jgi:hypothetical protein
MNIFSLLQMHQKAVTRIGRFLRTHVHVNVTYYFALHNSPLTFVQTFQIHLYNAP